jgi:hypothetical protein
MITGFEVGSVFKIIDEATGPLRKILESVRELTKAITNAREGMAGFSGAVAPGLAGAITQVNELTAAWDRTAAASVAAARAATASARSAAAASVPSAGVSAAATGGLRGSARGGGAHVTGPGIPLPGGGHFRLPGTPALIGAAVGGLSLVEAANMELDETVMNYHLGLENTKENAAKVRKTLEEGMVATGKDLPEVAKAATDFARTMRDTPGFDVMKELPKFLRAAWIESISKGTSLSEAMNAITGLAHMTKSYAPGDMEKMFPALAYLSTANPMKLGQMEKAWSYAVPTLQSGADVDPVTTMLLGTALATAGVTNTKGGTWLREMVVRSMPGDPDTERGAAHNKLLQKFGLLDANGKPTWFTNGRPDPVKALEIAGPIAAAMPPEERLTGERGLFGAQGAGGFSILADPKVLERARELRAGMESDSFKNRYNAFPEEVAGTTKQTAKSALQEFNVAMIELGTKGLPIATGALHGFTAALGWFTGGHQQKEVPGWTPSLPERFHNLIALEWCFPSSTEAIIHRRGAYPATHEIFARTAADEGDADRVFLKR